MNGPSLSTTPIRFPTARWVHSSAYTPDSTRTRTDSPHRPAVDIDISSGDGDALPTQFHSRSWDRGVSGGPQPESRDPGQGNSSEGNVSTPALTVPAKRKLQNACREVLSLACGNTADSSSATPCPSTLQRIGKTRPRTQAASAVGSSGHDHDRDQGSSSSHSPVSSTCSRSRRMVMDAVEIISKRRSRSHLRTVCDECPTKSTYESAFSHYPTPPASRALKDVSSSRPITESREHPGANATSPLKTSKYFTHVSIPPTRPTSKCTAVLIPSSSSILTIPVYMESSGFECPPCDASLDELVRDPVDESQCIPPWHNNSGLFDDLMIILRWLKPILVQESVQDDPWKVLIAVRLLNVTTGNVAIPVFCKIMSRWPTPQDLVHASRDELVELLRPLGLYNKRARWLKDISEYFLEDREGRSCLSTSLASLSSEEYTAPAVPRLHYPGVGPYAMDSLCIFCADDKGAWKRVMPRDKELVRYLRWRWAVEEGKAWYPAGMGVIGDVDVPYLITLVDELAIHYDSTIGGEGTRHILALSYLGDTRRFTLT